MYNDLLANEEIYHIYSRSIAGYEILNKDNDRNRMLKGLTHYKKEKVPINLSKYVSADEDMKAFYDGLMDDTENIVQILAYCLMPTHLHLILKQLQNKGISNFMSNLLNSYTRYFNTKYKRKGPLWESRFNRVLVKTDEQLLNLSGYIHINPVRKELVVNPEDWLFSSYREYLGMIEDGKRMCDFSDCIDIKGEKYKIYVENKIKLWLNQSDLVGWNGG